MKKRILLAIALMVCFAAGAFAGSGSTTTYSSSLQTAVPGLKGALSTNVQLAYISETNNTGYSVGAYHAKGTKTYASSSGDAQIWQSGTTGKAIPAAPIGTASAAFAGVADWNAI